MILIISNNNKIIKTIYKYIDIKKCLVESEVVDINKYIDEELMSKNIDFIDKIIIDINSLNNNSNEIINAIEIGIDNYRMYHPRYLEIENCIREHWENRKETENVTPGNDIADFTHFFAGAMTDKLIEMGKNNNYNMILEWGMREPNGPLNGMRDLKKNGYNNIVLFISTYKEISYEACKLRADIMKNNKHIIRKVPKSFHDFSVSTLPYSINIIYKNGYEENLIDYMALITRDNKIIWEDKNKELPGEIYNNCLNDINYIEDLNQLKQEIIYIDTSIFNINSKIK